MDKVATEDDFDVDGAEFASSPSLLPFSFDFEGGDLSSRDTDFEDLGLEIFASTLVVVVVVALDAVVAAVVLDVVEFPSDDSVFDFEFDTFVSVLFDWAGSGDLEVALLVIEFFGLCSFWDLVCFDGGGEHGDAPLSLIFIDKCYTCIILDELFMSYCLARMTYLIFLAALIFPRSIYSSQGGRLCRHGGRLGPCPRGEGRRGRGMNRCWIWREGWRSSGGWRFDID